MRGLRTVALFAAIQTIASPARAAREECDRPIQVIECPEWTFFSTLGGARTSDRWNASYGLGAELAWVVARHHTFPSGAYGGWHGDAEAAVGAWAAASIRGEDSLVEGGIKAHDGGGWHASWGTFDLRLGAGFGRFGGERAGHAVITLAYGVRSALFRYRERQDLPTIEGKTDVARVFGTWRHAIGPVQGAELVFGIELSPSFFFPPLTWWRVGGGPPI